MPDFYKDSKIKAWRDAHSSMLDVYPDEDLITVIGRQESPNTDPRVFRNLFKGIYGEPEPPDSWAGAGWKGLKAGVGQVIYGAGGAIDWLYNSPSHGPVTEFAEDVMESAAPSNSDPYLYDVREHPEVLLYPKWWLYNVGSLIPYTVASIATGGVAGTVGAGAGVGISEALGLGARAAMWTQRASGAIAAGLAGGVMESLTEAANVRNQAIEQGMSKEDANQAATQTFSQNMYLNTITQAIQYGKIMRATGTPVIEQFVKKGAREIMGDLAFEGSTEAAQEMIQNVISQTALGKDPMEGLAESGILGFVSGAGFGAGLEILDNRKRPVNRPAIAKAVENVAKEVAGKTTTAAGEEKLSGLHFTSSPEAAASLIESKFAGAKPYTQGEFPDPANGVWITTKGKKEFANIPGMLDKGVEVSATIKPKTFESPKELYDYVDPIVGRTLGNVHITDVSPDDPLFNSDNRQKVNDALVAEGYNAIKFGKGFEGVSAHQPGDVLIIDPSTIASVKPAKVTAEQAPVTLSERGKFYAKNFDSIIDPQQKASAITAMEDAITGGRQPELLGYLDKLKTAANGDENVYGKSLAQAIGDLQASQVKKSKVQKQVAEEAAPKSPSQELVDAVNQKNADAEKAAKEHLKQRKELVDKIDWVKAGYPYRTDMTDEELGKAYQLYPKEVAQKKQVSTVKKEVDPEKWKELSYNDKLQALSTLFNAPIEDINKVFDTIVRHIAKTRGVPVEEYISTVVKQVRTSFTQDELKEFVKAGYIHDEGIVESINNKVLSPEAVKKISDNLAVGAYDGKAGANILYAFGKGADLSALVHEVLGHGQLENFISLTEQLALEKWVGKEYFDWGDAEHEAIVYGFEQWITSGKYPTTISDGVKSAFYRLREFFAKMIGDVQRFFGWEVPEQLGRVYESWLSEKGKSNLISEMRDEVTNGTPIKGKRIVGSLDNLSVDDAVDAERQLRMVGYATDKILMKEPGKVSIMYYIDDKTKSDQIQRAIALQHQDYVGGLNPQEVAELGGYYGYSKAAIRSELEKRGNIAKKVSHELKLENESITSSGVQPIYSKDVELPSGNRKRFFKQVGTTEDGKVVLQQIAGYGFDASASSNIYVNEGDLEKLGFIKSSKAIVSTEDKKITIDKTGVISTPTAEDVQNEVGNNMADVAADERPNYQTADELANDYLSEMQQEAMPDVTPSDNVSAPGEVRIIRGTETKVKKGKSEVTVHNMSPEAAYDRLVDIVANMDKTHATGDQVLNDIREFKDEKIWRTLSKDERNRIQALEAFVVSKTNDDGVSLTARDVEQAYDIDPDNELPSPVEDVGYTDEQRADAAKELGMTLDELNELTDDQIDAMREERFKDEPDGDSALLMLNTKPTSEEADGMRKEGEKVFKTLLSKDEQAAINNILGKANLESSEFGLQYNKMLMNIGTPQFLARYNPDFFGKIFWLTNDNKQLAAKIVGNWMDGKDYKKIWEMPDDSIEKVFRKLVDGTLAAGNPTIGTNAPDFPESPAKKSGITAADLDKMHRDGKISDADWKAAKDRRKEDNKAWWNQVTEWRKGKRARADAEYASRGKVFTADELKSAGFNDDEISAYRTIRRIVDEGTVYWKKAAIANGMSPEQAALTFSLKGYFPLDRGRGKWVVVYDDKSSPKGYGMNRFHSKQKANEFRESMIKAGRISPANENQNVQRFKDLNPEFLKHFNLSDLMDLINQTGVTPDEIAKHPDLQKVLNIIKQQTYSGKRQIRRGNVGMEVDIDEMKRTFEEWSYHVASRYGSALTRTQMRSIMNPKSHPGSEEEAMWYRYAEEYVRQSFEPVEYSPVFDKLRQFGFLWALTFNVSNGLLNSTQPIATTLPALHEQPWGLTSGQANSAFMTAMKAGWKAAFSGNDTTLAENMAELYKKYPGLQSAMEEWKQKGIRSASYYENLLGIFNRHEKLLHTLGFVQYFTEGANRNASTIAGYISAYDHVIGNAKGNEKLTNQLGEIYGIPDDVMESIATTIPQEGQVNAVNMYKEAIKDRIRNGTLTEEEKQRLAMRFGARLSDTTNFVFGRHNLPKFIRANQMLQNPLKSAYLFKGFTANYLGFLATQLQSGRITPQALAYSILPILALSGITGLPFADDLKELFKTLGIMDTDTEVRKLINNNTLSDLTIKGIPAILWDGVAFDMSRRSGAGSPLPQGLAKGDIGAALTDVFAGAPYSELSRIAEGLKDLVAGNTDIGYRRLAPVFLSNVFKGIFQYPVSGAVDSRGRLLATSEKMSQPGNIALNTLGLKPIDLAKAEDAQQAIKYLSTSVRDRITEFNDQLARAILQGDKEKAESVFEDILQYNSKVENPAERYDFRSQMASIRRRIAMGTRVAAEQPQVPKSLRPEAMRIEQLYQ